jgi:heat-inducible transcriptional repressor
MELTERQKQILRAIVDNYVRTAEPVGSKTIAELPDMNFSSATIRNEMAALTEAGLLEQPHTSAGRVPSPAGYRLYVDELMQDYSLSLDETKSLNAALDSKMQQFDQIMEQVGKLVSQMTNLPAYVAASHTTAATVKRFEVIPADAHSFILVVMTNTDEVKNKLIRLPVDVGEQDIRLLTAVLNASLTGLTAEQFTPDVLSRVTSAAGAAAGLIPVILDFTTSVLTEQAKNEVYLTGQAKLLGQPEFQDVNKAQQLLTTLEEDAIANLPALKNDSPMQILVGPEDIAAELKDTSVVMTSFDIGDGMKGMIGVLGPQRMDYAQVAARLSFFAENLGRMFAKPELPPSPDKEE